MTYGQYYAGQPTQSNKPDPGEVLWGMSAKGRMGYRYPGKERLSGGGGPTLNKGPLAPWWQRSNQYLYNQSQLPYRGFGGAMGAGMSGAMGGGGGMGGGAPSAAGGAPWMQYGRQMSMGGPQGQYGFDQMQYMPY